MVNKIGYVKIILSATDKFPGKGMILPDRSAPVNP